MQIIEPKAGGRMFDELQPDTLHALELAIHTVDEALTIEVIDYAEGIVQLGRIYNMGVLDEEWTKRDFIKVNVARDSQAAAFKDVYLAAYNRCMF